MSDARPNSKFLNKQQIIAAKDIITEEVEVPEWADGEACFILVKALNATERDAFEASLLQHVGTEKQKMTLHNIRAKLVAWSIVDPVTLQRMFSQEEVDILGLKSGSALARVNAVCQRISKMNDKAIEEMAKNSLSNISDDSSSSSPTSGDASPMSYSNEPTEHPVEMLP